MYISVHMYIHIYIYIYIYIYTHTQYTHIQFVSFGLSVRKSAPRGERPETCRHLASERV